MSNRIMQAAGPVLAGLALCGLSACSGVESTAQAPAVRWNTAQPTQPADLYALDEIRAGNYAAAERKLLDTSRLAEDDPYRLLNLALVLQMTGRGDEAAALYGRVLEMEANPRAAVASGFGRPVKDIAESALARLDNGGI